MRSNASELQGPTSRTSFVTSRTALVSFERWLCEDGAAGGNGLTVLLCFVGSGLVSTMGRGSGGGIVLERFSTGGTGACFADSGGSGPEALALALPGGPSDGGGMIVLRTTGGLVLLASSPLLMEVLLACGSVTARLRGKRGPTRVSSLAIRSRAGWLVSSNELLATGALCCFLPILASRSWSRCRWMD